MLHGSFSFVSKSPTYLPCSSCQASVAATEQYRANSNRDRANKYCPMPVSSPFSSLQFTSHGPLPRILLILVTKEEWPGKFGNSSVVIHDLEFTGSLVTPTRTTNANTSWVVYCCNWRDRSPELYSYVVYSSPVKVAIEHYAKLLSAICFTLLKEFYRVRES